MSFPVVDAFLVCPEEGKEGRIGICTNTLAPTMVINEIVFEQRKHIAVIGSLVVSRDGAERMIVNSLSHPTLQYIILFGEETLSFQPSTNLLLAIMQGYDPTKPGNVIQNGKGVGAQYPSITPKLLELFKSKIILLPMYSQSKNDAIIESYTNWVKERLPEQVFACYQKILQGKKLYYDNLNELIKTISAQPKITNQLIELDPKEFQHLQPPIIQIEESYKPIILQSAVHSEEEQIVAEIDFDKESCIIKGNDSFLMAYSIMDYANKKGLLFPPEQQLFLGAELSRVEVQIRNGFFVNTIGTAEIRNSQRTIIPLATRPLLNPDKLYYYKIGLKKQELYAQSLAHDTCTTVFELRCKSLAPLLNQINKQNRFENYAQQMLHRIDVGIETGRAFIALQTNNQFFQDFRNLFSINTEKFPLIIAEADSFLAVHQRIITAIYTTGISESHPDAHKGAMRAGCVLAVYRSSEESLKNFPAIYSSGAQSVEHMRQEYKEQLLNSECEGTYTYGNRTRKHFQIDQIDKAIEFLRSNPHKTFVVQRFDYLTDMTLTEQPILDVAGNVIRTRIEATHDPCLTHDIYFIANERLHCFHIARAHNVINAYPENIFGLHDAYDHTISNALGVSLGDMFMLSSRANILLLTEEQKAKKLMSEPSKPVGVLDMRLGPVLITEQFPAKGIAYLQTKLNTQVSRPNHEELARLESYRGVNLIEKAASYLKRKGTKHNNPIIGTFDPEKQNHDCRLVFFQCNQSGKELNATAVFLHGSKETLQKDTELCNYLATQFSNKTELPLGTLFLWYVPVHE